MNRYQHEICLFVISISDFHMTKSVARLASRRDLFWPVAPVHSTRTRTEHILRHIAMNNICRHHFFQLDLWVKVEIGYQGKWTEIKVLSLFIASFTDGFNGPPQTWTRVFQWILLGNGIKQALIPAIDCREVIETALETRDRSAMNVLVLHVVSKPHF